MELKKIKLNKIKFNKISAITLVELIIALTMVAALMMMMFGIIFKKTKATIVSPTGTFYCWKDWNGNLHEKLIVGSEIKVSNDNIDACKLDFPEYLSKDTKNVRAYLIGGGASGASFEFKDNYVKFICDETTANTESRCSYSYSDDVQIKAILTKAVECQNSSAANGDICVQFDGDNYTGQNGVPLNNKIRSLFKNIGFNKCLAKHIDKVDINGKPTTIKNFFYDLSNNTDSCFYYSGSANYEEIRIGCRKYPFLYCYPEFKTGEAINGDINYKVAQRPNYTYKAPTTQNQFISADVKFDINSVLKIDKEDIGDPGDISKNHGNGGKTTLKGYIKTTPNQTDPEAKGVIYGVVAQTPQKFDYSINDEKFNDAQTVRYCCDQGSLKSECKYNYQKTRLSDIIDISNPELPQNFEFTCNENEKRTINYLNGNNKINAGFGLFGYNGTSGDYILKFKPYQYIGIFGKEITGNRNNISSDKLRRIDPSNGMGGAIIIQWN